MLNKIVHILVTMIVVIFVSLTMSEFLSSEIIAGWDLLPQYYLSNLMLDNLQSGQIATYDPHWFAGYPAFSLYGPLSYIIIALIHILIISSLDAFFALPSSEIFLSLNLFIFTLPFIFLMGFIFLAKTFFPKQSFLFSLLVGFFYLTANYSPHEAPAGLYGNLLHGHLAAFFGISLLTFIFAFLQRLKQNPQRIDIIPLSLLLSALILTHLLTSIFMAILVLAYLISAGKKSRVYIFIACGTALLLTSWWWINFLQHLAFSSGKKLGLVNIDPLLNIFPNLPMLAHCKELTWKSLLRLPYSGITLLLSTIVGVVFLFHQKKYFLPIFFLIVLLVLPRNFLVHIIETPLHYYRFIDHVTITGLLISVFGLQKIYQYRRCSIALVMLLSLALMESSIRNYPESSMPAWYKNLFHRVSLACNAVSYPKPAKMLFDFSSYQDAVRLMKHLDALNPKGRVAVETSPYDNFSLGSPHFFSTLLPLQYDISVLPGLLVESAYSSGIINSTLSFGSNSIQWGESSLYSPSTLLPKQLQSNGSEIISRFRALGVEYLIASSTKYKDFLFQTLKPNSEEVWNFGNYTLLKLKDFRPLALIFQQKPLLVVSDKQNLLKKLSSKIWNTKGIELNFPLVYDPDLSLDKLDPKFLDGFSGLLILNSSSNLMPYQKILKYFDNSYLILEKNLSLDSTNLNYLELPPLASKKLHAALKTLFLKHYNMEDAFKSTTVEIKGNTIYTDLNGNTLLSFAYSPYLKVHGSKNKALMVLPYGMFVFHP